MAHSSTEIVTTYFRWLRQRIEDGTIASENLLSQTVEIRLLPLEGTDTLLKALGYDQSYVSAQHPIQAGAGKDKLDFLVGAAPRQWMLELKAPGNDCARRADVQQLQFYMQQPGPRAEVPFGVLFSGDHAALYVNPKHKALRSCADRAEELETTPVDKVVGLDIGKMARFFGRLCIQTFPKDSGSLARGLAKKWAKGHLTKADREIVQTELERILLRPDEEVARAIIDAFPAFSGMEPSPSPQELLDLWPGREGKVSGTPPNREAKQLVAMVCRSIGYQELERRKPNRLRLHVGDPLPPGHSPVPPADGVPPGLTVGSMSRADAESVIRELKKLLCMDQ